MSLEAYMRKLNTVKSKYIERISTNKDLKGNINYLNEKYDVKDATYKGELVDSVNISKLLELLKDLTAVVKPYINEGKDRPAPNYCDLMSNLILHYSSQTLSFFKAMKSTERDQLNQHVVTGMLASNSETAEHQRLLSDIASKYLVVSNDSSTLQKVLNQHINKSNPENLKTVHRFLANELAVETVLGDIKVLSQPITHRKIIFENIIDAFDTNITSKLEKTEDMEIELHDTSKFLQYALVEWFSIAPVSTSTEIKLLKLHSFILKTENEQNSLSLMDTDLKPNLKNLLQSLKTMSGVIASNILGQTYSKEMRIANELGLELDNDYWLTACLYKEDLPINQSQIEFN